MELQGKFYSKKKNDFTEEQKKCIEDACAYCIENSNQDSLEKINKPIMMLGKIQSGKTRAFTGLIALAFDNSFDMIIILTKNSKALVQQTVSRMKEEFNDKENSVLVNNIIKVSSKMSGFELERKNIIVAKKEKGNIQKLIEFIDSHSINDSKKCLIIDDEADTTGIGYQKVRDTDEYTLRVVSQKVNEMRGTLNGCVFIQVTATPYSLYLQPDFNENDPIKPVKPNKTILVPHTDDYIGGEYYFFESKDDNHPASLLFEEMSQEECDLVSNQKRKGKKSKIEDRRSFKVEEILLRNDRLKVFKKGIMNFLVGAITLRVLEDRNAHYAYVIHTSTEKKSHLKLEDATTLFLEEIKNRNESNQAIIQSLLQDAYSDIKKSIEAYKMNMPEFKDIENEFYMYIDREYYSVSTVNADKDIEELLDENNGELRLKTPCSIFVGGQILDRGVTIPNMIGFYYGRNPKDMQQDTVLQHSRMFGYRKKILPVTRFYTTRRIHNNMEKITEIDMLLRNDIQEGKQGNGVYFITNQMQDASFGKGKIKPCSPDKIKISDIILLNPHKRVLPVGFTPCCISKYNIINKQINKILNNGDNMFSLQMNLEEAEKIINLVYSTFDKDDDSNRFITKEEFITTLKYMSDEADIVHVVVKRDKENKKIRTSGRLEDSPAQGQQEAKLAQNLATDAPAIILLQEQGNDESWKNRPFWWPILMAPKNVKNTIYASKIVTKKVKQDISQT